MLPERFGFVKKQKNKKKQSLPMARPQVTITLGRSGQKVVKRPLDSFGASRFDSHSPALSGSKRSSAYNDAEDSSSYTRKRLQMGMIGSSSEYSRPSSNVAENDLRQKLLRQRLSKQMELDLKYRKKRELEGKISRNIQTSKAPERFRLLNGSQTQRAGESSRMESVQTSYSSSMIDGSRPRTANGVPQISGGMLSSRAMGQVMPTLPTMQVSASRSGLFQHPHSKGPTPLAVIPANTRAVLDPYKSLIPATRNITKTTYLDEHLTVSSLLNALGLGKYSIIFQAEEVDMAALKQMGDRDLKEIGIPMGPRKKILLALLTQSKRRTT